MHLVQLSALHTGAFYPAQILSDNKGCDLEYSDAAREKWFQQAGGSHQI